MTRVLRKVNLVKNLKTNPKAFWKYAKSKIKTSSKIGDLQREDGTLVHDPKQKADLLNKALILVMYLQRKMCKMYPMSYTKTNPPP